MNFSLILASRSRVNLLKQLLNSIYDTTMNLSLVEVIVVIDDDDPESNLSTLYPDFSFVVRKRSQRLNDDYINYAFHQSNGRYLIPLNDDVVFKTRHWDEIAQLVLDKYEIVYGRTLDAVWAGGLHYSCFPIVSRVAADRLGYLMPGRFLGWGADLELYQIFRMAGKVVDVPIDLFHDGVDDDIHKHVGELAMLQDWGGRDIVMWESEKLIH